MSHFQEQAPADVTLVIGGREYRFSPLRYRDHAEAARKLQAGWPQVRDVIERLGANLPEHQQRILIEIAYDDARRGGMAELDDVFRWYRTPEGALFRRWLMLRRNHPELSLEDVDELLATANWEETDEIERTADACDGMPEGNAPCPPANEKTPAGEHEATSTGGGSSATSPNATDGRRARSPS